MGHHVDPHDHDHDHHHDHGKGMGFEDKLIRRLDHWAKHNHEHAQAYRQWAGQARDAKHTQIADLLDELAAQSALAAVKLEGALNNLPKR
jgi:hypothetical protein